MLMKSLKLLSISEMVLQIELFATGNLRCNFQFMQYSLFSGSCIFSSVTMTWSLANPVVVTTNFLLLQEISLFRKAYYVPELLKEDSFMRIHLGLTFHMK